jgi:hypothetical protein
LQNTHQEKGGGRPLTEIISDENSPYSPISVEIRNLLIIGIEKEKIYVNVSPSGNYLLVYEQIFSWKQ